LGRQEAFLLARLGSNPTFTIQDARKALGHKPDSPTSAFLDRLERKGWIRQIKRGRFAVIPLSSGENRFPQLHEFVIAMNIVSPAAIAYWSALNHHGMTEQIPQTVFVATNHRVRRPTREALGIAFKIVSLRPNKFFGVTQEWIDEQPVDVTDREKTLVDGLDMPEYVGGVGEIAKALVSSWPSINEKKLQGYAIRIGNSAVVKRLGCLLESLKLGHPDELRKRAKMGAGFSALDPTLPKRGRFNRKWGLLINTEAGA
jgi:predicted transcriptional regulator of viral defense system